MLKQLTSIFKKCNILFQGKERPAQKKCMMSKLPAVLVRVEADSAQCQKANNPTPRNVSQRRV